MPYEISIGHPLKFIAKGRLTVSSSAIGIPASDLDKAQGGEIEAFLGVETDQIRVSPGGADATTTDKLFDAGDKIRLAGAPLCRALTMIRVTGDATVTYWLFGKQLITT